MNLFRLRNIVGFALLGTIVCVCGTFALAIVNYCKEAPYPSLYPGATSTQQRDQTRGVVIHTERVLVSTIARSPHQLQQHYTAEMARLCQERSTEPFARVAMCDNDRSCLQASCYIQGWYPPEKRAGLIGAEYGRVTADTYQYFEVQLYADLPHQTTVRHKEVYSENC
jgi:hypothetical protein